jgi:nucleoside-diphosphate-sugar epimerase
MDTVAVTGGNGTLGRAVVAHLNDSGYRTVNLSRGKADAADADAYSRTDLLDAGEVYGSLARSDADAVAHLGMLPTPERTPGHVTFRSNATSSYHVLEAAAALGIESVALASSLSALGAGFEPTPIDVRYLPVDEEHPAAPTNPYGLGKLVVETVADGFGRGGGAPRTVGSLRFPWVVTPDDVAATFDGSDRSLAGLRAADDFETARDTLFSYVCAADAARAVELTLTAGFEGHERFFPVVADTTTTTPSRELARTVYPEATVLGELEGTESLVSGRKAADLLGWRPERSWRS